MPKQTKLGDDALIYQPRKKQTEKEKLKDMNFRGKLDYLWEYYKLQAIAIAAGIALIIYFINSFLHPTNITQFYAAMINNTIDESVIEQYSNDFAKQLELNTSRENVFLNTAFNFEMDDTYSMNIRSALITYISANQVDVIIAPESEFYNYAYTGYFYKLSDQLPTDVYSSVTDKFYMTHTQDDAENTAYGIYLTDTDLYKNNADNSVPYVLGIVYGSKHKDNTIKFIKYLFNQQ